MPSPLRALYVDLDHTLLGAGASLLLDGEGMVTALGVRAVEAALRAGAEVVPITGRRQAEAREAARLLGARSYLFESGSAVVLDGEEHWLTGDYRPGDPTIHEQIAATQAPNLLLAAYHDCLELHDPWNHGREVSHVFRGCVDTAAATALLARQGHGDLRLLDNGRAAGEYPSLDGLEQVRVYHLLPVGASKADGVAFHRSARGYGREETVAVGDSPEDLACATEVDRLWLVANALRDDPTMRELAAGLPNVRVAEEAHGPGVYEAVITELAERR